MSGFSLIIYSAGCAILSRTSTAICLIPFSNKPLPYTKTSHLNTLLGFGPNTFSRIVRYANAWIGIADFDPFKKLGQIINGLREEAGKK